MGPPLRGQATVEIVTEGRLAAGMPAFGPALSEAEIEAVVEFANDEFG